MRLENMEILSFNKDLIEEENFLLEYLILSEGNVNTILFK